uniref:NADH dehydrogenase subunit 3 n=1 Tax=Schmidtea mediterranea TaxID=79327 RepID=UPI0005C2909D
LGFCFLGILFFSLGLFLLFTLWLVWLDLLGYNSFRESQSVYECGFDSKDVSRFPFSFRFFLIVILFVILDVELCFVLQMPFELFYVMYGNRLYYLYFILLLVFGVWLEYFNGLLVWK